MSSNLIPSLCFHLNSCVYQLLCSALSVLLDLAQDHAASQRRQNPALSCISTLPPGFQKITYWRHLQPIARVHRPFDPSQYLKQQNLHLQQHKPLPETLPRMRIERDIRAAHRLPAKPRMHLTHRPAPSLRLEFVCVGTPDRRVDVHSVCIPADKRACRNGDLVTEHGGADRDAVDELRDGRVETQKLVDDGCEIGEGVDNFGGWRCGVCRKDFGAEAGLDFLQSCHQVRSRWLGRCLRREKGIRYSCQSPKTSS